MKRGKKISVLFLVSAFVLVGGFGFSVPKVLAAAGAGTATISDTTGTPGVESASAGVTAERGVSDVFTVILSVGTPGMTLGASSPTFTVPANFTAPTEHAVATLGDVLADGQWSVIAAGGGCTVSSAPGSVTTTATGQVITVDVTADCAAGHTIKLTYKGTSAVTMGATAFEVRTADGAPAAALIGVDGPSPTITVTDTIAPTVTIGSDKTTLKKSETAAITFTLSESSVNFIEGDVSVAGGTLSAFAGAGTSYTATFTPTDNSTTLATINVATPTFTDAAGTANSAATQLSMTVDTIAPTVTVTMSSAALTAGQTAVVTFTFSEAPTGFDATDVNLTNANGTIGAIDDSVSLIQTATFTPTDGITDATNVITVGTAWTDAALNAGIGGSSPNYTINTIASSGGGQQYGTITVIKTVINDNGGTKVVADFPLFVNDKTVVSGVTNTFPAPTGVYTVTEISNPNYTRTFSGGCGSNGRLTLSPGDMKICVVTNDDIGAPVAVPPVPPLIDVVKVPSPLALTNGSGPVTYTYTLTNTGTVPVQNITMVGDTCSPITLISGDTNGNAKLEVSETWVYKCSTTLSQTHTNIVTTTGWANGLSAVDIASATVVVGASVVPPLIHVTKVPSPLALTAGGESVTYTEKVTNPGTVALSNVHLTDDKCSPMKYVSGDTNNDSKLDTAETWVYICKTILNKTTTNTATATGDANGLTAKDFAIATVVVANPKLPNTGFPPRENSIWDAFLTADILAILLLSLHVARKKHLI